MRHIIVHNTSTVAVCRYVCLFVTEFLFQFWMKYKIQLEVGLELVCGSLNPSLLPSLQTSPMYALIHCINVLSWNVLLQMYTSCT